MTDDTFPDAMEIHSDDHQQAIEIGEHALDALRNGDLSRAHSLFGEARTAVERAQHDDTPTQEHREIAFDCYD